MQLKISEYRANKLKTRATGVTSVVVRMALLYAIAFTIAYPILFMFVSTFRSGADLYNPSVVWITRNFTLDNLKYIYDFMSYPKLLAYTLLISGVSALLQVFSCGLAGYGFARYRFRGRTVLFIIVMFSLIIPVQTYITPLYMAFRNFNIPVVTQIISLFSSGNGTMNLIDNPFAFWVQSILGMGLRSGLFIFIFRQFYANMPKEFDDAGRIDGCGHFGIYFKIMLPNATAAITVVFIFSFVWHWNDYFTTSVLSTNASTLATALSTLRNTMWNLDPNTANDVLLQQVRIQAGALLCILPLLILFVVMQKFITESVEKTGIVG